MRGSTSRLVLLAGGAVLLVVAILLVQATRLTEPAPAPPPSRAASAPAPVVEARGAVAPAASPPRERPASPAAPRAPSTAPRQPELAIAPPRLGFSADLKRDASGRLVPIITMAELRAQAAVTDAPMKACIERSGSSATGKATLSFTVSARNGKLAIETTGVQDDETLAGNPELLECMHRTAHALVVADRPVPELGTPIYVRRHVRIDNGALVENSLFDFSYNP